MAAIAVFFCEFKMSAETEVKFFFHTNNNSPQIENAYGSMIDVLDACLINGINIGETSNLTILNEIVTLTFAAAHKLERFQVIKVTGFNLEILNNEHRILEVIDSRKVSFKLSGAPDLNQETVGVTVLLAPLGWEKPFSSTNPNGGGKAAYRSKNTLLASRPFLRIIDELDPLWSTSYSKYAKVGIVESMQGIDVLGGTQAPFDESIPSKNWSAYNLGGKVFNGWAKWQYARLGNNIDSSFNSSTPLNGPRQWVVIGSGDAFYVCNGVTPTIGNDLFVNSFGFFENEINTDTSNWFLSSLLGHTDQSQGHILGFDNPVAYFNQSLLLFRSYKNSDFTLAKVASTPTISGIAAQAGCINYVTAENLIPLSESIILESETSVQRGVLPNILRPLSINPFPHLKPVLYDGYMLLPVPVAVHTGAQAGKIGQLVFNLGGVNAY